MAVMDTRQSLEAAAIEQKGGICRWCPKVGNPQFDITIPFANSFRDVEPSQVRVRTHCTLSRDPVKPKRTLKDWQQCPLYRRWKLKQQRDAKRRD